MTLGWVYQYWNDPEREALDAKLNSGGKVEPHEIASKTQMFTERYMVDWLLQNSLGPMWLSMCKGHGWTPACEADGTLDALEARRVDWRAKREAGSDGGGVELTDLMPLHTAMERRWAYYVPQPIPDSSEAAADSGARSQAPRPGGRLGPLPCRRLRPAPRALPRRSDAPRRRGERALGRQGHRRAHPRAQPAWHRPRPARRADRGRRSVAEGQTSAAAMPSQQR